MWAPFSWVGWWGVDRKSLYTCYEYHFFKFPEKPKESSKLQKQKSEKAKAQNKVDLAADTTNVDKFVEKVFEKVSSVFISEVSKIIRNCFIFVFAVYCAIRLTRSNLTAD